MNNLKVMEEGNRKRESMVVRHGLLVALGLSCSFLGTNVAFGSPAGGAYTTEGYQKLVAGLDTENVYKFDTESKKFKDVASDGKSIFAKANDYILNVTADETAENNENLTCVVFDKDNKGTITTNVSNVNVGVTADGSLGKALDDATVAKDGKGIKDLATAINAQAVADAMGLIKNGSNTFFTGNLCENVSGNLSDVGGGDPVAVSPNQSTAVRTAIQSLFEAAYNAGGGENKFTSFAKIAEEDKTAANSGLLCLIASNEAADGTFDGVKGKTSATIKDGEEDIILADGKNFATIIANALKTANADLWKDGEASMSNDDIAKVVQAVANECLNILTEQDKYDSARDLAEKADNLNGVFNDRQNGGNDYFKNIVTFEKGLKTILDVYNEIINSKDETIKSELNKEDGETYSLVKDLVKKATTGELAKIQSDSKRALFVDDVNAAKKANSGLKTYSKTYQIHLNGYKASGDNNVDLQNAGNETFAAISNADSEISVDVTYLFDNRKIDDSDPTKNVAADAKGVLLGDIDIGQNSASTRITLGNFFTHANGIVNMTGSFVGDVDNLDLVVYSPKFKVKPEGADKSADEGYSNSGFKFDQPVNARSLQIGTTKNPDFYDFKKVENLEFAKSDTKVEFVEGLTADKIDIYGAASINANSKDIFTNDLKIFDGASLTIDAKSVQPIEEGKIEGISVGKKSSLTVENNLKLSEDNSSLFMPISLEDGATLNLKKYTVSANLDEGAGKINNQTISEELDAGKLPALVTVEEAAATILGVKDSTTAPAKFGTLQLENSNYGANVIRLSKGGKLTIGNNTANTVSIDASDVVKNSAAEAGAEKYAYGYAILADDNTEFVASDTTALNIQGNSKFGNNVNATFGGLYVGGKGSLEFGNKVSATFKGKLAVDEGNLELGNDAVGSFQTTELTAGNASFGDNAKVAFNNNLTLSNGNVEFGKKANVELEGTSSISGSLKFGEESAVNIKGALTAGNVEFGDNADVTFYGNLTLSGNAEFGKKANVELEGTSSISGSLKFNEESAVVIEGALTADNIEFGKNSKIEIENTLALATAGKTITFGDDSELTFQLASTDDKGTGIVQTYIDVKDETALKNVQKLKSIVYSDTDFVKQHGSAKLLELMKNKKLSLVNKISADDQDFFLKNLKMKTWLNGLESKEGSIEIVTRAGETLTIKSAKEYYSDVMKDMPSFLSDAIENIVKDGVAGATSSDNLLLMMICNSFDESGEKLSQFAGLTRSTVEEKARVAIQMIDSVRDTAYNQLYRAPVLGANYGLWASAFGDIARNNPGNYKANSDIYGFEAGIDAAINNNWTIGLLAGYGKGDTKYKKDYVNTGHNSCDTKSYFGGVYGLWSDYIKDLDVKFSLMAGHLKFDEKAKESLKNKGSWYAGNIDATYKHWEFAGIDVGPWAAFSLKNIHQKSLNEVVISGKDQGIYKEGEEFSSLLLDTKHSDRIAAEMILGVAADYYSPFGTLSLACGYKHDFRHFSGGKGDLYQRNYTADEKIKAGGEHLFSRDNIKLDNEISGRNVFIGKASYNMNFGNIGLTLGTHGQIGNHFKDIAGSVTASYSF